MKALPSVSYSADLMDRVWALLEPVLPPAKPGGRGVRAASTCGSFSTVYFTCCVVVASGGCCRARTVLGPRVYTYHRAWRLQGVWERIHTLLRGRLRRQNGREPAPSAAIMK
jgi:putative transposase